MSDPDIYRRLNALEATLANLGASTEVPVLVAGSWTPALIDTGGGVSVASYTTQVGRYRRRGDLVWIQAEIVVATISGVASGAMRLQGLPVTPATGFYPLTLSRARMDYSVVPVDVQADVNGASNIVQFTQTRDNLAIVEMPATAIAVSLTFNLSGWYLAA